MLRFAASWLFVAYVVSGTCESDSCDINGIPSSSSDRNSDLDPVVDADLDELYDSEVTMLQTGMHIMAGGELKSLQDVRQKAERLQNDDFFGDSPEEGPFSAAQVVAATLLRVNGTAESDSAPYNLDLSLVVDGSVPAAYVMVAVYFIIFLVGASWGVMSVFSSPAWYVGKGRENMRLESSSWNHGITNWILMDWVPILLNRFNIGHQQGRNSTIKDLGPIGCAEDESVNNVRELTAHWEEDVRLRGIAGINLFAVLIRFCGRNRLIGLASMCIFHELALFLGPTMAIQFMVQRLVEAGKMYMENPGQSVAHYQTAPVALMLVFYSMLPIFSALVQTASYLVGFRVNMKISSGLYGMIYRKSQRLPLSTEEYDLMPEDEKNEMDWGKQRENTSKKSYSVVALCQQDAGEYIAGLFQCMSSLVAKVPLIFILAVIMCIKMGTIAGLYCCFALMICGVLLAPIFEALQKRQAQAQHYAGQRLSFLQENMYNIRLVKGYGWEDAMEEYSNMSRVVELRQLRMMYLWMIVREVYINFYPRFCMITGILLMYWVRRGLHSTDIFAVFQAAQAYRIAVLLLFASLPQFLAMMPSIKRIDCFLKLPECPWPNRNMPGSKTPDHIRTIELPKVFDTSSNGPDVPRIRVKGSFTWNQSKPAVLKDVNVEIFPGELVALVGEVGSGKSTLLSTLMGELWPCGDSVLELPKKAAFSSQAPHIMEGTLKENVLFYAEMDREKYEQALFGACLEPDLKVLPGGDEVPIGSRGIVLSGGQKARVSLARAAFRADCNLVLVDDPFSAVDFPTGNHIMNHYLKGEALKGRTTVVCMQPDQDRIYRFDRVILMADGQVVADGAPSAVVKEANYQRLLDKYQKESDSGGHHEESFKREAKEPTEKTQRMDALRDQEIELSEWNWGILNNVLSVGGWMCIVGSVVGAGLSTGGVFLVDLPFGQLTTALANDEAAGIPMEQRASIWPYFAASSAWWIFQTFALLLKNFFDIKGSMNVSIHLYRQIMHRLARAPVDFFYDKTPVGRIMNRIGVDLLSMDFFWFVRCLASFTFSWNFIIPILFVHFVAPLSFSFVMVPFYWLLWVLAKCYWNLSVPVRHCILLTRSAFSNILTDAETGHAVVRGYGEETFLQGTQHALADDLLNAFMQGNAARIWLVARLSFIMSFIPTAVGVIGLLFPGMLQVGITAFLLQQLIGMNLQIEGFMETLANLQMEMISAHRINEFMHLPQERPDRMPGDERLLHFDAHVAGNAFGTLEPRTTASGNLEIVRTALPQRAMKDSRWRRLLMGKSHHDLTLAQPQVVLSQVPGTNVFAAKSWLDLDPTSEHLAKASDWHRLASVNSKEGDAKAIAEELCYAQNPETLLGVKSVWLANGARVVMKDVVAGYANIPANILKGVNLTIEPKTKAGIMGSTGCGKSTMLTCLLRLIEIRKGKIEFDGVNIGEIGTTTLRRSMGLVPQEPVMFSGPIRVNLDPFHDYSDEQIWQALEDVGMAPWVRDQPGQLFFEVKMDGSNLSVGERQLFCIARMLLRRPRLLLLDEATSAIDPATQEKIIERLHVNFKEATVIAIAHRLETILDFDMAVVMAEGKVAESGPIKELVRKEDGLFAAMVAAKKSMFMATAQHRE